MAGIQFMAVWSYLRRIELGRIGLCLGLLLIHPASPALAWVSPAPDVVLYATPALEAPLRVVAGRFTTAHHVDVHIFLAPPDGLIGLIGHRARADVVVADTPTLARLAAAGLVRSESLSTLGRDPFVLVGQAGAASPQRASAAELVTLRPTVLPDSTTAASFDGAAVLRAAFPGQALTRTLGVSDTPTVLARVRQDARLIGLVYRTEAEGFAPLATLNVEATTFGVALVTNGQSGQAAALLTFIAGPDGAAEMRRAGLEAAQ